MAYEVNKLTLDYGSVSFERGTVNVRYRVLNKGGQVKFADVVNGNISGLPRFGDAHPDFPAFVVSTFNLDFPSETAETAIVTVQYTPLQWKGNQSPKQPKWKDPLNYPPRVSVRSSYREWSQDTDLDGRPFQNSAGEPLTAVAMRAPIMEIDVEWRSLFFDFGDALYYIDAVNSDSVNILGYRFEPETLLVENISADRIADATRPYWEIRVSLRYQERRQVNVTDGQGNVQQKLVCMWDQIRLDEGYYKESTSGSTQGDVNRQPILDAEGTAIVRPALLDGNGQPLPDGQPPVYLWFRTKKRAALSALFRDLSRWG